MSKRISKFQFKQFAVSHHRSSMRVGVDGVLIGCWADAEGCRRILDVGTGCGLIALIIAQRIPDARIDAIDIDDASIEEAVENISASPWKERINAFKCGYADASTLLTDETESYDLIVSNPPYFNSGVTNTVTAREIARHQGELSPSVILKGAKELLRPGGSVAMIVPSEISPSLNEEAECLGYRSVRKCLVRGHDAAPYKRVLLQWRLSDGDFSTSGRNIPVTKEFSLTLEVSPGNPTEEYRALCKDFYLRF